MNTTLSATDKAFDMVGEVLADVGIFMVVLLGMLVITTVVVLTLRKLCRSCGCSLLYQRAATKGTCVVLVGTALYWAFAAVGVNLATVAISLGMVAFTLSTVLSRVLTDIVYGFRILQCDLSHVGTGIEHATGKYVIYRLDWLHVVLRTADETGAYSAAKFMVMSNEDFYNSHALHLQRI